MTIHRIEYLILSSVIQHNEIFINVASDFRLSHAEVVVAADRLFQKGYILAGFRTEDEKFIEDITLNRSQIQAHLDGKFNTFYYLTPEGEPCGKLYVMLTGINIWEVIYPELSILIMDYINQ